jgi:hypothetical protein
VIRTTASELKVGDVFYRETYRKPNPTTDWPYTVSTIRRVPQHDFFGKQSMMVEIQAVNRVTGPAKLTFNEDEGVWLADATAPASPAAAPPAGGDGRLRRIRRWR